MGKLVDGEAELDSAFEAASMFRTALLERCKAFLGGRDITSDTLTDLTVQALVNESLHRNAGRPEEVMKALCHGLAMIVAQQPDAMVTTGEIATRILQFSAVVRADIKKVDLASAETGKELN